ncbi:MAG: tRNA (guanosine(46)-N7)-methyltransferase TrmB [Thermoanaerobaculia bacterium]
MPSSTTEQHLVINPRETGFAALNMAELFGNTNPVILEIGSGKGRFLIGSAMERPDINFIGIEKSLHYHRLIRDRILKRGLQNIRLINHDAFQVMQKMFADASVAEIHIYFPDPWPRPKEQKRRIIRADALTEMRRVLVDGGSGIYVTDHREYAEKAAPEIAKVFRAESRTPGPGDPPRTNYEAKYRAEGRAIFEVRFWKDG